MKRHKRTKEDWQRLVQEWNASGLSAPEFARTRGINPGTLAWWRRAIQGGAVERWRRRRAKKPIEFLELRENGGIARPSVELVLRNGRRLALFGDLTGERLVEIVAALEQT